MSSPSTRYGHVPGLRLRPVHELGICVAFAPTEARLYRLNPPVWLLLELCRAVPSAEALRAAYLEAVAPPLDPEAAEASLREGLELLLRHRLVRAEAQP